MLHTFKNEVISLIRERYHQSFYIEEEEWEEVLEQVRRHLFTHYTVFGKDIFFEDFIENVWLYVKIKRERMGKGLKNIGDKSDGTGQCGED